jgi:hypothetical protein
MHPSRMPASESAVRLGNTTPLAIATAPVPQQDYLGYSLVTRDRWVDRIALKPAFRFMKGSVAECSPACESGRR